MAGRVAALLCLAAALLLAPGCTGFLYPWPDLPKAARVPVQYPPIPKSEITPDNAAYYLMQLKPVRIVPVAERGKGKVGSYSGEQGRFSSCGWEAGRYPDIEAAAGDFAPNLRLLRRAAAAPEARMPVQSGKDLGEIPLSAYRCTVDQVRFLAEAAAAQGNWDDVADLLRLGLAFSRTNEQGGVCINRSLSIHCDNAVMASLRRIALERTPPPEWLRAQIALLQKKDAETVPMSDTFHNEIEMIWRTMQESCDGIFKLPQKHGADMDIDPAGLLPDDAVRGYRIAVRLRRLHLLWLFGSTEARTRRHVREIADSLPQEMSDAWRELAQKEEKTTPAKPRLWWFNDPVGRFNADLASSLPKTFAMVHRQLLKHQATLRATELVLALRLYQREHGGRLPAKLEELVVAGCLARLPDDPLALAPGTPFCYRVNTDGSFVLWSRGDDGKDDGGAYDPANPFPARLDEEKDIVFSSTQPADQRAKWLKKHPK